MPVRLALLGMWHTHADGLVKQIAEHPDEFTLVSCYDSDANLVAQRLTQWGPKFGKLPVVAKAEQIFDAKPDGVVVEGRVYENLRLAKLALEQGKPVLLEKPAGDDMDEFRRLIDMAQRKHLHVQLIYLFRYMAAIQSILERARKGDLGHIYHYSARLPKDLGLYARYVDELGRYKGGMFFEMAGHVIDLMIALLGKPQQVTPFLAHHHREGPANFVDNGLAVFTYPNAYATVEVPALETAPRARRIEIFGTTGALVIPHLGSGHLANKNVETLEVFRQKEKDWKTERLPAATLQIADLREFAAVLAGKKRPDFSTDHDLAAQETLLQASGMLPIKR